nr:MAG TPA: hypothetical protein [Caudoviricetes sp.]
MHRNSVSLHYIIDQLICRTWLIYTIASSILP